MTKTEAQDFIARHYTTYINRIVRFEHSPTRMLIKAIDVIEGENGNFIATCFIENPETQDPDFKDHILSHVPLQEVIEQGTLVPF